ncbi:MAG TPA: M1 family metallopeptidase [Candidatus Limnocylindria bacterium]|nr:M1 family metallopeptidase [Candidatus Limnocylindria bacterium]
MSQLAPLDKNYRLSKDVMPSRYELRFELDLDRWASVGHARIALRAARPFRELVLHAVELDITGATVDRDNSLEAVRPEPEAQVVVLRFAREVGAGEHTVDIRWTGGIRDSLRGLYRSVRGEERYAATQFEAADARRAYPCFDEPEFKARFALELVYPSGNTAIANMPIVESEDLPDNRTRTRFRETPLISPYLVAFTVGPYESTPEAITPSKIPVRVWLPPGLASQAIFARDAHVRSVEWLQDYTGIPYPYYKVDAIGIPDFEAGAMENPGAITYRTRLLAADKNNASIVTLKGVFSTAAHELTHMWWGDLVTMRWWTDLWLNESFASFVGEKCTAALNPEWNYWRDFVADNTGAFNLDALASTHAISIEAKNAEEATERFDAITYTKGAAVLRMIESYLGEDAFRAGVRIYLDRHREANASADDFWHALDEASGEDVTSIMNAWIREPGHPLVSIRVRDEAAGVFELSQSRYYSDTDAPVSAQLWPVPLVLRYGTANGTREVRVLLRDRSTVVTLEGATWLFPNAGGRGFYRWHMDEAADRMLDRGIPELAPEERLSLVDDLWALTRTGRASLASFLRRLDTLTGEEDRAVIAAISDALTWLSAYAVREPTERPFARFIESFYRPIFEKVGWRPRENEDPDTREKRGRVIGMLGFHARAADVRRDARDRALRHLDGVEPLHPDGAGVILAVAATEGDHTLWDRYVARMQSAQATDAQEEARFRQSLVAFEDEALAQRTADAIFSHLIRAQDRGLMVVPLLQGRRTRGTGWNAIRERWDTDIAGTEPLLKQRFVQAVGQLSLPEFRDEAIAFLESKRTSDIAEAVKQSVERLRINTAAAERLARELEDALAEPAGRR